MNTSPQLIQSLSIDTNISNMDVSLQRLQHLSINISNMNVSPQLLQPLSIDTNIMYDLDMSMFPGLDDPGIMFQPALVVSTPEARQSWLSALEDTDPDEDDVSAGDLFQLIESCSVDSIMDNSSSGCSSDYIQNFFDDVIHSTSSVTSSEADDLSFSASVLLFSDIDTSDTQEVVTEEDVARCSPGYLDGNCPKRKRELENLYPRKTMKVADGSPVACDDNIYDLLVRDG